MLLLTERLALREMTANDAEALYRLSLVPLIERFTGDPPLADVAAAAALLEERIFPQYRSYGVGRWAVVRRSDDAFLGWCGLKYLADRDEYDLGYRLFEEHWGQGYGTEAADAVLAWGRQRLGDARIAATVLLDNASSIHVLEKIGMVRERVVEDEPGGAVAIYVAPQPG